MVKKTTPLRDLIEPLSNPRYLDELRLVLERDPTIEIASFCIGITNPFKLMSVYLDLCRLNNGDTKNLVLKYIDLYFDNLLSSYFLRYDQEANGIPISLYRVCSEEIYVKISKEVEHRTYQPITHPATERVAIQVLDHYNQLASIRTIISKSDVTDTDRLIEQQLYLSTIEVFLCDLILIQKEYLLSNFNPKDPIRLLQDLNFIQKSLVFSLQDGLQDELHCLLEE